MADLVLGITKALIESIRLPGARTPAGLARWIEDTPELKLNLSLLAEAFLQLLASGLGTLALVWATVVLLGGYSTMLVRMDFWFTTAIVFVETARIVGYNSAPEAKFFVNVAGVFSQKKMRVGKAINLVRLLTVGPTWLALAPIFAATACMLLSTIRLVGIATQGYGSSGGTDASNGNLKPALVLFYALVLTQGVLFLLWFAVAMNRLGLAEDLGRRYLRRSRIQFIDRYVDSIADTCIQKGVSSTINTTLVSFAAELLLQSQDPDDHVSAVLVLHLLLVDDFVDNTERSDRAVEQICSLEKCAYRLVRMLFSESENLDSYIKANIAGIVRKLACKLRLSDMPGAAHLISSLLDPHLMKKAPQITRTKYDFHSVDFRCLEAAFMTPLFVHGLVILGELASDPENCTEMYNTVDLVPKIIAPVSNGLHMAIKDDATTVQIARESLRVVAKLTRGTGESSRRLCHELTTTKYGRTPENIVWILNNSEDHDMRMLAVEILSRLTLDAPRMLQFTAELQSLFFDPRDIELGIEAGKALIALGNGFPEIQHLVTIMSADAAYSEYSAVTAEMLAKICARSKEGQDRSRLSAVANLLSPVLKAIVVVTVTTDDNTELDKSDRKFLASLLGLAVQIREKLATAGAFADAVTTGLSMENNLIFADTLKRIIELEKHNEIEDETCLAIIKSATKLVTWVAEIDTIRPGYYYTEFFRRVNIVDKLYAAVRTMVYLERYVIMTGAADEKEGYVTLQTLVETVRKSLEQKQQQQQ